MKILPSEFEKGITYSRCANGRKFENKILHNYTYFEIDFKGFPQELKEKTIFELHQILCNGVRVNHEFVGGYRYRRSLSECKIKVKRANVEDRLVNNSITFAISLYFKFDDDASASLVTCCKARTASNNILVDVLKAQRFPISLSSFKEENSNCTRTSSP